MTHSSRDGLFVPRATEVLGRRGILHAPGGRRHCALVGPGELRSWRHLESEPIGPSVALRPGSAPIFPAGPADSAPVGPRRDLPCSGPSCSQRRGLPQAPAPSSPVRSDPWCCTIAAPCWDGPDSPEELADLSRSLPRHNTSPPERPPQSEPRTLLIASSQPAVTDRSSPVRTYGLTSRVIALDRRGLNTSVDPGPRTLRTLMINAPMARPPRTSPFGAGHSWAVPGAPFVRSPMAIELQGGCPQPAITSHRTRIIESRICFMNRTVLFTILMAIPTVCLPPAVTAAPTGDLGDGPQSSRARVPLLSDEEAWKRLPAVESGGGQPLPSWARALAGSLPRTTAAMLNLDRIHRTRSPLGPMLRGKMRWVAARANHCEYSMAQAEADLKRAGLDEAGLRSLKGDHETLPEPERAALEFAHRMTVDAAEVTDDEVAASDRPVRRGQGRGDGPAAGLCQLPGSAPPGARRPHRGGRTVASAGGSVQPEGRTAVGPDPETARGAARPRGAGTDRRSFLALDGVPATSRDGSPNNGRGPAGSASRRGRKCSA